MVSSEEYFYYLRKAFKKNHIHGYMIDCKANRKTCIYSENGKWVESEIRSGVTVSPKEYDFDDLWHACEDIIARLSRDEEHRKKTWMDWASPTNWAEKMDVPITIRKLTQEEARKLVIARRQGDHTGESVETQGADILAEIDKGIDDMESGRITPHEQSMEIISHILPIYLERVSEELCNSFDEDHQVIIGHDFGRTVWIQAVEVSASDKILSEDIKEVGKEISVNKTFFDRVLKSLFVKAFDPNMTENKNRYTYAFSEEGRYLTCFEEDILESNFFTYEQIEKVLDAIEDCVRDGAKRIEERIGGKDTIQLVTFAAHMRRLMAENPDLKLISVLS